MADNRIQKRDSSGKIRETKLTHEQASEMGKARWSKPHKETQETLLQEAGYDDPQDAPEHLRVLASIAASERTGSVAALRDFLRLTRPSSDDAGAVVVQPGTQCPTCHQWQLIGLSAPRDALMNLLAVLDEARANVVEAGETDSKDETDTKKNHE